MVKRFWISLLCCLLPALAGCRSVPLKTTVADSPIIVEWAQQWYVDQDVFLEPGGLTSAGDALYVYGAFSTPAAAVRSFLFRSWDGGQTWTEVGHPVRGSRIIDLSFPDPNHGWALVGWTTEGPGEIFTQATKDGGLTWTSLPEIPKDHYSGWPTDFGFTSQTDGELVLEYWDDNPGNLRPVFVTKDGGKSWQGFVSEKEEALKRSDEKSAFAVRTAGGEALTLEERPDGWALMVKTDPAPTPRFLFPRQVPLDSIVELAVEDCGCPSQPVRGRMLK